MLKTINSNHCKIKYKQLLLINKAPVKTTFKFNNLK